MLPSLSHEMRTVHTNIPYKGLYEFVKRGDPPVMGMTKVGGEGATREELMRPRMKLSKDETVDQIPATHGN